MMRWTTRSRFRIEAITALLTAALAVITSIVPDWIEVLTGTDPDHGDGGIEVLIVAVLAVLCLASSVLAWLDYRRAQTS
ncbi:MAG TPA: hypothetical protein VFL65_10755 [Jatrophihabitans sp.]|nr:hypothetical protein [Jatrophihabitans sp.]